MRPLILYGMHRSGTSLMVRLLTDLGVHMGSWLSRDAESVHFQRLNRRVYAAAGSKWAVVDGLVQSMTDAEFVAQQEEETRRRLFEPRSLVSRRPVIADFFGTERWRMVRQGVSFTWGWKDPRTTLTLPIWLRIFPDARCVHMIRNGIDVAISTHRRSVKQQRKLRNRLYPMDHSPATLDFAYCFRLWETYVSSALDHKHLVDPGRHMEMRYEDLLADPNDQMQRLIAFSGHSVLAQDLAAACQRIDRGRLDNTRYQAGYRDEIEALGPTRLMQELGYSG